MPLFRYRAVDQFGEPLEGTMEEGSAARVTAILRERGAQVNEVMEIGGRKRLFGGPRRIGWSDIATLNSQLLAIVRGKIPVAPSIQAMAKDLDNRRLKPVLDQLRSDLEAGRSLEEAFQRSPRIFPPIYLSLIRAGERSGNLTAVLEMISTYSTRILDLRERVMLALIYPTFVVGVIFLALINIFFEIIPTFESIFDEFGGKLPAPTQFLVNVSHFLRTYPAEIGGALVIALVVAVALRIGLRTNTTGRGLLDRMRERVPIIGRTFRTVSLARFSKALGLMLDAGVPMTEALDLAGAASANEHLRNKVREASVHVAQGDRLADALSDTRYFPHSYLWFLANGESRGQLPSTLVELSETSERQVSVRDDMMTHLITPVTVVVLGGFVTFVVVAMYLPIFTLGDAITGP
jgi:type IV pilus assembly protein PilC